MALGSLPVHRHGCGDYAHVAPRRNLSSEDVTPTPDNGSQHRIRRREVALELEGLPFGAAEQLNDVHNSAEYSEVPSAAKLPS